jgi:hypothetical protein
MSDNVPRDPAATDLEPGTLSGPKVTAVQLDVNDT